MRVKIAPKWTAHWGINTQGLVIKLVSYHFIFMSHITASMLRALHAAFRPCPSMPIERRHRNRSNKAGTTKQRSLGYTTGTFRCPYCFTVGSTRRGGENKHLASCREALQKTCLTRESGSSSELSDSSPEVSTSLSDSDTSSSSESTVAKHNVPSRSSRTHSAAHELGEWYPT